MLDSIKNIIKNWIDVSLVRKVGIGLVAMAVLVLLTIGGVFFQVWRQQTDALAINLANLQLTLSQSIANHALLAVNGEPQAIEELQGEAKLFDQSLQKLRNGDTESGLPPAPASVRSQLDVVDELWKPIYQDVQAVLEATLPGGQVQVLAASLNARSESLSIASEVAIAKLKGDDVPVSPVYSFAQQLPASAENITDLVLRMSQGQIMVATELENEVRRFGETLAVLSSDFSSPAREELQAIEAIWTPYYADVQVLLAASEKGLQASQAVVAGSKPLLQESSQAAPLFQQQAQDKITELQRFLVGMTAVFLLIFGLVLWSTRRLIYPLTNMSRVAAEIAEGDLGTDVVVNSRDEIGRLAQAFNSMTAQLRNMIGSLEGQVQERTAELTLSIEVGQRAAAIRDLDELLPTIVEFIRERFNLYYTHVYFVDDIGQNLVLKAGTGSVGKELLSRRHSVPLSPDSIVGQVAATGQAIVVSDTETSDIHKPNPLLPETRSELAVPLVIRERVIGALDMQASRANTFTKRNLTVFEAMATQLAIAIDSARQWVIAQQAQQKSAEAIRQLTHQTWAEKLTTEKRELGFAYDLSAVTPLSDSRFSTGDFGLGGADNGDSGSDISQAEHTKIQNPKSKIENGMSVSVVVQNEAIGQLSVETPPDKTWTEDEHGLLEAVAQQLAQKAENLRLFEQTQQRATREQIARQITDKIRASRDIETALKTAAEELSKALDAPKAVIDLKVAQVDKADDAAREK